MTAPDFYRQSFGLTDTGSYGFLFDALPDDITALVAVVQGLGVYDLFAERFYGVSLTEQRGAEIHLRGVKEQLERLLLLSDKPLTHPRPPDKRLACRCRHFTLLLVAMLRHKGTPARARCGFATYFNAPCFEDHWVCEYWSADAARWVLVDPQLDAVWREKLHIDFDLLDMPRDRFLTAGAAWQQCRSGEADPTRFGISFAGLYGLWFIAGSLVRELAALNKIELLPWDVWGAQPQPGAPLTDEQLTLFDTVAALTHRPDANFEALRTLYENDERLRVPLVVFNALRNQREAVSLTDPQRQG